MTNGSDDPVLCQLCNLNLEFLELDERQVHYNSHFDGPGPSPPRRLGTSFNSPPSNSTRAPPSPKQNVFWHPFNLSPPPKNYCPGLIPLLKRIFIKLHAKGMTTKAVLCADGVCHVGTELFDIGWGCGYRNFLMTCTSLISQQRQPMYFPLLDVANGSVSSEGKEGAQPMTGPGVRGLQAWIENAWCAGYDPEGANDEAMNWKLIGTKKFIGTSDIYVAFTACGIPCCLVDFPKPPKGKPNPKSNKMPQAKDIPPVDSADSLIRWIVNYFDNVPQPGMPEALGSANSHVSHSNQSVFDRLNGKPVMVTERMPIILQHNGHSRTIIGYEITKHSTTNLLIFDPGKKPDSSLRKAGLAMHRVAISGRNPYANLIPSSPSATTSKSGGTSPLRRVLNHLTPKSSIPSSKRRSTSPPDDEPRVKRLKPESGTSNSPIPIDEDDLGDNEKRDTMANEPTAPLPVQVSDAKAREKADAEALCDTLNNSTVLRLFRVNHNTLSKKDQYQILFFPLTEPLTDHQKQLFKTVTSTVIASGP